MSPFLAEIAIILVLVVLNGVLAMSEIAVVSSRKARLQQWAEAGRPGAAAALALAENPAPFLSTVQIGITLIGIGAGAFGGATLGEEIGRRLRDVPFIGPYASAIGFAIVVTAITYVSLVIGELVPKRIALSAPERIASTMARPLMFFARVCSPLERLLTGPTDILLRLARVRPAVEPPVTEEEINVLVGRGEAEGVFDRSEKEMVAGVLRLGDIQIAALMTPRADVVWLEVDASPETIGETLRDAPHSRLPVGEKSLDAALGFVHAKELAVRLLSGRPLDLRSAVEPALVFPESLVAPRALDEFRSSGRHMALVVDEHGGIQGLVTLTDVVAAFVGRLAEPGVEEEPEAVRREDGSWLLDGRLPIARVEEILGVEGLGGDYSTVAGLVINRLGRHPATGARVDWNGLRFEVVDMDGRRVDELLVTPLASPDDTL